MEVPAASSSNLRGAWSGGPVSCASCHSRGQLARWFFEDALILEISFWGAAFWSNSLFSCSSRCSLRLARGPRRLPSCLRRRRHSPCWPPCSRPAGRRGPALVGLVLGSLGLRTSWRRGCSPFLLGSAPPTDSDLGCLVPDLLGALACREGVDGATQELHIVRRRVDGAHCFSSHRRSLEGRLDRCVALFGSLSSYGDVDIVAPDLGAVEVGGAQYLGRDHVAPRTGGDPLAMGVEVVVSFGGEDDGEAALEVVTLHASDLVVGPAWAPSPYVDALRSTVCSSSPVDLLEALVVARWELLRGVCRSVTLPSSPIALPPRMFPPLFYSSRL